MQPHSVTYYTLTDDQLAALEERIVERVSAIIADHWLPRQPMTPDGFAEWMNVSRETVRRWTIAGHLDCWQLGHVILYTPDHIAAFLAAYQSDAEQAA